MASFRVDMISEETRKEIDRIIREDLNDPRIRGTYAVTRAEVTRDLRHGKIFVSVLEDEYADGLLKALGNAAGFIRGQLSRSLQLRYTPELTFVRDRNIAYGIHIAQVLKQVLPDGQQQQHEDDTQH